MSKAGKQVVDHGSGEQFNLGWEQAYQWLCRRRQHAPTNSDVWDLRFNWSARRTPWLKKVLAGEYRLSPMQFYRRYNKSWVQWSAS